MRKTKKNSDLVKKIDKDAKIQRFLCDMIEDSKDRAKIIEENPEYFHDGFDYDLIETFKQFKTTLEMVYYMLY